MALTRSFLKALGIEDEKIEEIIKSHTSVTDALKEERDNLREEAGKIPALNAEVAKMKKMVESADSTELQGRYDTLQNEFEMFKADIATRDTKAAKEEVYRRVLKEVNISDKRVDAIVRLSDIDNIELDEDGGLKNADAVKESITKEWSDYIITPQNQSHIPPSPPQSGGGEENPKSLTEALREKYTK